MFVGPPGPEKTQQEFLDQIRRPAPAVFICLLLASFCGSAGWMAVQLKTLKAQKGRPSRLLALAVSIVISCSVAAMDVATKGWSAALHGDPHDALRSTLFWASLLAQAWFFIVSKWGMLFGCSRCDVLLFVPLNIVLNIFFAVAAGMVVLGEASQVPSASNWFGILASWACVVAGILMLVRGPADIQDSPRASWKTQGCTTDESRSDSDTLTEDDTGTGQDDECETVDRLDASGGARAETSLKPPCWFLVSQTFAVDRLNRAHINAANARMWWREQVLRHLSRRPQRRHFRRWLSRHGTECMSERSRGEDSDSSDGSDSSQV